ncbi:MAG: hypothetical protein Q9186_003951 [Xanthomendoza sp. 1 TL-2023]
MPLDHFSLAVPASKVDPLVSFFTTSLAHMGFKEHIRYGSYIVGLGEENAAYFWIAGIVPEDTDEKTVEAVLRKQHIAFTAESEFLFRFDPSLVVSSVIVFGGDVGITMVGFLMSLGAEQVQQFHVAALKAGGKDNGAPGPRPQYHPGYYGAFVLDPVFGVNVEVVCHKGAAA